MYAAQEMYELALKSKNDYNKYKIIWEILSEIKKIASIGGFETKFKYLNKSQMQILENLGYKIKRETDITEYLFKEEFIVSWN